MKPKKNNLANALLLSLSPIQRQALGALLLRGGDDGECFIEEHLTSFLHDDSCDLGEQLSDVPDCTKCEGTGKVMRKEKEIKCSQCKGLGKFDPVLPNFAFGLAAEQTFVFDMYGGHEDPWEKYPYLAEDLVSALESEEATEETK